jgi:hypothetical protein
MAVPQKLVPASRDCDSNFGLFLRRQRTRRARLLKCGPEQWTTGAVGGLFQKAFHFFSLHREEFLSHYHKRSNIESANSMIKRKLGDFVRSKTDVAMKSEALCKVLAHNICCPIQAMHEFGVKPDFCSLETYQATIA